MTIRNLDPTFRPRSVAVVGASQREGSVGAVVLSNIVASGFPGQVFPVNLKYDEVQGLRCYRQAADLPEPPDLAVIITPPSTIPSIIAEFGAVGCKGAVIITAGVDAKSGLRSQMLEAAKPSLLRIVGPNTIGLISPHIELNASFAHIAPKAGGLGLISQSGAIVSSVVDWAATQDIGFSQIVSLGDMADVDVGDCLNWMAADPTTSAILMYLEAIPAPRKFMSAARAAARIKPVICLKAGRHHESAQAALTHTGSLAGSDEVSDAALRRAGVVRVDGLEDLFYSAEIMSRFAPLRSGRVAIVTNGGGAGVLAIDKLLDEHATLATLSAETIGDLSQHLPATWSKANPVDIIGDAPPERYRDAVQIVAKDPGVDVVLAMNCPTALASPTDAAAAVASTTDNGLVSGKPLLACWLGKQAAEPARSILRSAGIATADTPAAAAQAVSLLTRWQTLRTQLDRVPPSSGEIAVDRDKAAKIIAAAAAEGRSLLTEPEAKECLTAYGIASPPTLIAHTEDEVAERAAELLTDTSAVVVKLLSRTITHKSDLGGVVLGITSPDEARRAAARIRERLAAAGQPAAALDGFTVQPMVRRPHAEELLVGLHNDPSFGPVVLFGAGGISVEVVKDTATGLMPLDELLAGDLIDRTRIAALLKGYRDRPPADRSAIIGALLGISQLAVDFPAVRALDVNPLLADADGAVALDVRIEIDPARAAEIGPGPELAVRPYPTGWERMVTAGAQSYAVRPMRPADAALFAAFREREYLVDGSSPVLTMEMVARLGQLDYDRDIAFVALEQQTGALAGIVRYAAGPDHVSAEFSVHIRSDLREQGLATAMMQILIDYARADHLMELTALVPGDNLKLLSVAKSVGFEFNDEVGSIEMSLMLD